MTADQVVERLAVIDIAQFRLDAVERLQKTGVLAAALGRRQIEMNGVRKDQQAEVVLKRLTDVGQHQHGVDGVVEFRQFADAGGHHAADVEAENDVLTVFAFVDGGDRLVAAGSGFPADMAIIVVGRVVAVVTELAAGSGQRLAR